MVLKATHSPNQSDNLPEYEMLANGNPGKKPAVRIQENPLAEVAVDKPPNDMVQLRIEKGASGASPAPGTASGPPSSCCSASPPSCWGCCAAPSST
ncbi:neprilysin-1 [Caerostris extrusa]|uniref:Neprilysin-1 n=1 Tax=Caerostris extrusa TaxID=172846 RepID=A0AAV4SE11_CAEEX|nr:neprilysin-1 [Caerostris extrusa]